MTHTRHGVTPVLQVLCWRSVCVLYTLLVCVLLPEFACSAKHRCGAELITDLQFVCGDRGFYRGHPGAVRGTGPRRRMKGIVEQCCVIGCDLKYLEPYCAEPKQERRRHTRHTQYTLPTLPTQDRLWRLFLRRYNINQLKYKLENFTERLRERMLYHRKLRHASAPPAVSQKNPENVST